MSEKTPDSGRKLFFGLFVFPLLIAVGMAVLLCAVVLLTNENETPDTLIAAIKTGAPSKRWEKAFELSNELNRKKSGARSESVMKEVISILRETKNYDEKTRGYMALTLSHFKDASAREALRNALKDPSEDVRLYALWGLGANGDETAVPDVTELLSAEREDIRKTAAYVLGVIGNKESVPGVKKLLQDPISDVRWNAALALARLGDDSGYEELMKMLQRNDLETQYQMPDDQIEKVMINAVKGLALIRKPESIKILEALSREDKSLRVRQAAIEAMEYHRK